MDTTSLNRLQKDFRSFVQRKDAKIQQTSIIFGICLMRLIMSNCDVADLSQKDLITPFLQASPESFFLVNRDIQSIHQCPIV